MDRKPRSRKPGNKSPLIPLLRGRDQRLGPRSGESVAGDRRRSSGPRRRIAHIETRTRSSLVRRSGQAWIQARNGRRCPGPHREPMDGESARLRAQRCFSRIEARRSSTGSCGGVAASARVCPLGVSCRWSPRPVDSDPEAGPRQSTIDPLWSGGCAPDRMGPQLVVRQDSLLPYLVPLRKK